MKTGPVCGEQLALIVALFSESWHRALGVPFEHRQATQDPSRRKPMTVSPRNFLLIAPRREKTTQHRRPSDNTFKGHAGRFVLARGKGKEYDPDAAPQSSCGAHCPCSRARSSPLISDSNTGNLTGKVHADENPPHTDHCSHRCPDTPGAATQGTVRAAGPPPVGRSAHQPTGEA